MEDLVFEEVRKPAAEDSAAHARHARVPEAVPATEQPASAAELPAPAADFPARPEPRREKRNNLFLMVVEIVGLAIFAFYVAQDAYDNDLWFLLATGREIVETGIPYVNPWTLHEGLGIVIQQWIPAVVLYLVHGTFGMAGLKVLVFAQICLLTACLYALCRVCSDVRGRCGEVFLAIIALAVPALQVYWSVRPHLYTMIMFTVLLIVLEKYRRTSDVRFAVLVPFVVLVHVNLHMSMAPFDLFVIALYAVPDVFSYLRARDPQFKAGFGLSAYPRVPLLIALGAAAVACVVNPYGIKGALYLLESYGAADYSGYINEMGAASIWIDYGFAFLCSTVLGAMVIGRNGIERVNFPLTVLFIVLIPLTLMHVRNIWLLSLFAIPLIAQGFGRISLDVPAAWPLSHRVVNGVLAAIVLAALAVPASAALTYSTVEDEVEDDGDTPLKAMLYLNEYVQQTGVEKRSLRIYNSFNLGGYGEYYGYRVFMDPRPELWEPGITGVDRHYYKEFVDFSQGRTDASEVVEEYQFDFLIAYSGSKLETAVRARDDYERVFSGDGYTFWAKKTLTSAFNIDTDGLFAQIDADDGADEEGEG